MFVVNYVENSDYGVLSHVTAHETREAALAAMRDEYVKTAALLGIRKEDAQNGMCPIDGTEGYRGEECYITTGNAGINIEYDTYQWTIVEFPEYGKVR